MLVIRTLNPNLKLLPLTSEFIINSSLCRRSNIFLIIFLLISAIFNDYWHYPQSHLDNNRGPTVFISENFNTISTFLHRMNTRYVTTERN
jgi:hypothetical protein